MPLQQAQGQSRRRGTGQLILTHVPMRVPMMGASQPFAQNPELEIQGGSGAARGVQSRLHAGRSGII